ncbi:uncharacterized protein LOC128120721 [Peromyscus californicus insignis]|uniref:uncharacterized protein LOC128120721 n=1 Tax=Peromyscus californicus insignis TaxID=564181 RepID=UPI0022A72032|nr:uncharacterized protein LOC128120721 [Peromyscus californicus insignis]
MERPQEPVCRDCCSVGEVPGDPSPGAGDILSTSRCAAPAPDALTQRGATWRDTGSLAGSPRSVGPPSAEWGYSSLPEALLGSALWGGSEVAPSSAPREKQTCFQQVLALRSLPAPLPPAGGGVFLARLRSAVGNQVRRAGSGNGDPGLPRLLAPAAGVQRALCARLSTELGEPLQAPPLVNSSPHWSAASLPTAPQRSRRRLRIYCSAHEILMQERLAGRERCRTRPRGWGWGRPRQTPSLRSGARGSETWGVHLFPPPAPTSPPPLHKGATARLSLSIPACSAAIATLASGEAHDGRRRSHGPGAEAREAQPWIPEGDLSPTGLGRGSRGTTKQTHGSGEHFSGERVMNGRSLRTPEVDGSSAGGNIQIQAACAGSASVTCSTHHMGTIVSHVEAGETSET